MGIFKVIKGDITKQEVDAIVNAANSELKGGGGVDGAIHQAGGPTIMEECRRIGTCPTGEAVITTAGDLPSQYVIHTVGPIWNGGNQREETLLANSYLNSLKLATKYGLNSMAFPNISTGIYGFPKELAAKIAIETVVNFLNTYRVAIKVYFICFDEENYMLYKNQINV